MEFTKKQLGYLIYSLEMFLDTIEGCQGVDDDEFNTIVDLLEFIKKENKKNLEFEDIKL